jgi:hypothetical protein
MADEEIIDKKNPVINETDKLAFFPYSNAQNSFCKRIVRNKYGFVSTQK